MAKPEALSPPMNAKERAAWRQALSYMGSAVAIMQTFQDPGIGAMAAAMEDIIVQNRDQIVQAYRDSKIT